jgi:hypothetical protein
MQKEIAIGKQLIGYSIPYIYHNIKGVINNISVSKFMRLVVS